MKINKICLAPMMAHTDLHFRNLMRIISKHMTLYTEMVHSNAILNSHPERYLYFNEHQHPLVLQLGGNNAKQLAQCAVIANGFGYDQINLNVGCPSQKVEAGEFGAVMMRNPQLVGDCIASMSAKVSTPITVKCRLGVDNDDDEAFLMRFIDTVSQAGCETFIVHARKAILNGLSAKQNRSIPPLDYEKVKTVKKTFPHLNIIVNGGIKSYHDIDEKLNYFDGVMIGRGVINNPYYWNFVDEYYFDDKQQQNSQESCINNYLEYIQLSLSKGVYLKDTVKPILNVFHGCPGAKKWKQMLCSQMYNKSAGVDVVKQALEHVTKR